MVRAFAVLLLLAAPALARPADDGRGPAEVHVMPDGTRVPTPEIAALDCAQMRAVLRAIDGTGYRGADPLSLGDPNLPLFDYENRLAGAVFQRCSGQADLADPSSAFTDGFKAN